MKPKAKRRRQLKRPASARATQVGKPAQGCRRLKRPAAAAETRSGFQQPVTSNSITSQHCDLATITYIVINRLMTHASALLDDRFFLISCLLKMPGRSSCRPHDNDSDSSTTTSSSPSSPSQTEPADADPPSQSAFQAFMPDDDDSFLPSAHVDSTG